MSWFLAHNLWQPNPPWLPGNNFYRNTIVYEKMLNDQVTHWPRWFSAAAPYSLCTSVANESHLCILKPNAKTVVNVYSCITEHQKRYLAAPSQHLTLPTFMAVNSTSYQHNQLTLLHFFGNLVASLGVLEVGTHPPTSLIHFQQTGFAPGKRRHVPEADPIQAQQEPHGGKDLFPLLLISWWGIL